MGLFDQVMEDRKTVHQNNPALSRQSADSIITSYSNTNAIVSGTLSLIPGPMGMLAVVPEIMKIMQNQVSMVYDIGASYGKETVITKELLLGIVIGATGAGAASLLVMQGGKVLVKRATLSTFQKFVTLLSGRVTQQALKSAIGKWLPGIGAVAIAAWSHYMTRQIGKQAKEIFEKEIGWETIPTQQLDPSSDFINSQTDHSVLEDLGFSSTEEQDERIEFLRVKTLVNLIRVDGVIEDEEKKFLVNIVEGLALSKDEISKIKEGLRSQSQLSVNFQAIAKHPDQAISLMVDLIAVAKRDGNFHITEKMYIKKVGQALNLDVVDIEEMMSVVV